MFSEFSLTWPVGVLKSIQKIESAPSKPSSMIFSGLDFGLCVIAVLTYSTRLSLPLALFFDFFLVFIVASDCPRRTRLGSVLLF
jgi:hypothetical protein